MTEQHPIGDHTSDESLRARSRRRVRSDDRDVTRSPSGVFPLTRALGTLLVVLIWWVGQHPWPDADPVLASVLRATTPDQREHCERSTNAACDAVAAQQAAIVSLSVSLPPPPVPPIPAPVVPAPVAPTPAIPHPVPVVPAPVIPYPIPVVPHHIPVIPHYIPVVPAPVIPHPVPVVPAPTPTFPPPVSVLTQVPNLVGDNLAIAEQVLMQDGLTVGSVIEQGLDQPAGTIVQTIPEANTAVPAGTPINLVVAE